MEVVDDTRLPIDLFSLHVQNGRNPTQQAGYDHEGTASFFRQGSRTSRCRCLHLIAILSYDLLEMPGTNDVAIVDITSTGL